MTKRKKQLSGPLMNLIIVSDLHCGCRLGLCPPQISLDDGAIYKHTPLQADIWKRWQYFWEQWVPVVTKGEPYGIAINGDALDGVHHNAVTQITNNLTDQARIAKVCILPIIRDEMCRFYYHLRGTEAHVGASGQMEERLAAELNAEPDEDGRHARWELKVEIGTGLIHMTHHIGTASPTTVYKELQEAFMESARWGQRCPDVICRSHVHRHIETRIQTDRGFATSFTTPGWQAKTPFVYRLLGGRQTLPQIGGCIIRAGDEDHIYTRYRLWNLRSPRVEEPKL